MWQKSVVKYKIKKQPEQQMVLIALTTLGHVVFVS